MRIVEPTSGIRLEHYERQLHLAQAVSELRKIASPAARALQGRRIWMLNSTATGGGVAEMLPRQILLLRELGFLVRWAVIEADDPKFFAFTKRLHNLLHNVPVAEPTQEDRDLYLRITEANVRSPAFDVVAGDIVVAHDPQPLAVGALLKDRIGTSALWRSHIGVDAHTKTTSAVWRFLRPWAESYDRTVFTLPQYVPSFLAERASIIPPAIDPLSHKNRELAVPKLTGILQNAGLTASPHPPLTPEFERPVRRLQIDGSWGPATVPEDLGLLARPIVLQVSRWDRLKGFDALLEAFAGLKASGRRDLSDSGRCRRKTELARLVLAGPDPDTVADDPEGLAVLSDLQSRYRKLDPPVQKDVAVLSLPNASPKENALIVNALQRCASVVVQASRQEGFGLTVTEAMWKGCTVVGTQAAGIRAQIRDGIDGRLVANADSAPELAEALREALDSDGDHGAWGTNARERVAREFLVLTQLRRWVELFEDVAQAANPLR